MHLLPFHPFTFYLVIPKAVVTCFQIPHTSPLSRILAPLATSYLLWLYPWTRLIQPCTQEHLAKSSTKLAVLCTNVPPTMSFSFQHILNLNFLQNTLLAWLFLPIMQFPPFPMGCLHPSPMYFLSELSQADCINLCIPVESPFRLNSSSIRLLPVRKYIKLAATCLCTSFRVYPQLTSFLHLCTYCHILACTSPQLVESSTHALSSKSSVLAYSGCY